MTDVQGACGVGRHEFDVYAPSLSLLRPPIAFSGIEDVVEDFRQNRRWQSDVDEPRTGDFHREAGSKRFAQLNADIFSNFPRLSFQPPSQLKSDIGCKIAMFRITRPFNWALGIRRTEF